MSAHIKDSDKGHWVNRSPLSMRPYLQLSRLDRPVGYWLLTLPGWIGLAFATLSHGFAASDLKWALLILIGAIAMRGAGCTYNDIVDQDLDAKVDRSALRPLPAGTVTTKQAWIWTFAQCFIGLMVLLCLPRLAQIISLCSIPLVAAYPFMKRITWWPQLWLGLTFNWAVLVAYATKTGTVSVPLLIFYVGLIFWTVGYDTIYACQDIEDDAIIGVKSSARRLGKNVNLGVGVCFVIFFLCVVYSMSSELTFALKESENYNSHPWIFHHTIYADIFGKEHQLLLLFTFGSALLFQAIGVDVDNKKSSLMIFKFSPVVMLILIIYILWISYNFPPLYRM